MSENEVKPELSRSVRIPAGGVWLEGDLIIPEGAAGIVLFVHGSGSSRHSPRNQFVAKTIRQAEIGTLLFDLLTRAEEADDMATGHLRFDIGLLAERLVEATRWAKEQAEIRNLLIGYFGASTGAAAALVAAARLGQAVRAVVSRGGRPDLAISSLPAVKAPTLLIVGGRDQAVIQLNWQAYEYLKCEKKVEIVDRATHLFEEPGALEEVASLAASWFEKHFQTNRHAAGQ